MAAGTIQSWWKSTKARIAKPPPLARRVSKKAAPPQKAKTKKKKGKPKTKASPFPEEKPKVWRGAGVQPSCLHPAVQPS